MHLRAFKFRICLPAIVGAVQRVAVHLVYHRRTISERKSINTDEAFANNEFIQTLQIHNRQTMLGQGFEWERDGDRDTSPNYVFKALASHVMRCLPPPHNYTSIHRHAK